MMIFGRTEVKHDVNIPDNISNIINIIATTSYFGFWF